MLIVTGKYVKYNRSHVFSLLFCCVVPKGIFRPKGQEIWMRASEKRALRADRSIVKKSALIIVATVYMILT